VVIYRSASIHQQQQQQQAPDQVQLRILTATLAVYHYHYPYPSLASGRQSTPQRSGQLFTGSRRDESDGHYRQTVGVEL
jgi:hypothetical protein